MTWGETYGIKETSLKDFICGEFDVPCPEQIISNVISIESRLTVMSLVAEYSIHWDIWKHGLHSVYLFICSTFCWIKEVFSLTICWVTFFGLNPSADAAF